MRVITLVSALSGLLSVTLASRSYSQRSAYQDQIDRLEPHAQRRDVYDACPSYCAGTRGKEYNFTSPFICGDDRLGPKILPTLLPMDALVGSYRRFDGLCPGEFLRRWTDVNGSWVFPGIAGFSPNLEKQPIAGNMSLPVGTRVDRFGYEGGRYVSPAGTPYVQRALPPQNLDTPTGDPRYPYNYRVYEVQKAIVVLAGPIAPWFGQPGGGVQYMTYSNISRLLRGGYLRQLNVEEFSYGGFTS